jgi:hypothetical protein
MRRFPLKLPTREDGIFGNDRGRKSVDLARAVEPALLLGRERFHGGARGRVALLELSRWRSGAAAALSRDLRREARTSSAARAILVAARILFSCGVASGSQAPMYNTGLTPGIGSDHAPILPRRANPNGWSFRERHPESALVFADRLRLAGEKDLRNRSLDPVKSELERRRSAVQGEHR